MLLGNEGDVLTITGVFGSITTADATVTVGGVTCTVTAATSASITCTLGNGPLDTFPVIVNIAGKGNAASTASDFSYTADVTSVSPTSCGLAGLTLMLTLL